MQKFFLIFFLLGVSTSSFALEPSTCLNVSGKYSISDMICQGQWDEAFLVYDSEMLTGSFEGFDTLEIIQKNCKEIRIKLSGENKAKKETTLPNFSGNKNIKMRFQPDGLRMHQGGMFKRFIASFERAGDDLIVVNEFAKGMKAVSIMRECQIPRILENGKINKTSFGMFANQL